MQRKVNCRLVDNERFCNEIMQRLAFACNKGDKESWNAEQCFDNYPDDSSKKVYALVSSLFADPQAN